MSHITSERVIDAAYNLVPVIHGMRDELDATRHVPTSLAEKMTAAGFFQLHACRELGGPELPPLTGFQVIEKLSSADGSVRAIQFSIIGSCVILGARAGRPRSQDDAAGVSRLEN